MDRSTSGWHYLQKVTEANALFFARNWFFINTYGNLLVWRNGWWQVGVWAERLLLPALGHFFPNLCARWAAQRSKVFTFQQRQRQTYKNARSHDTVQITSWFGSNRHAWARHHLLKPWLSSSNRTGVLCFWSQPWSSFLLSANQNQVKMKNDLHSLKMPVCILKLF